MEHLPERFQFRHSTYPGFTHTCKRNAHGDYEVTWARGYPERLGNIPNKLFYAHDVEEWMVRDGYWTIVDFTPKQDAGKLPNEFYFTYRGDSTVYRAVLNSVHPSYDISWDKQTHQSMYTQNAAINLVKEGAWKLCKAPLTPSQERTIKQYREQQAQLDSSIKIQQQDIEHKMRLISNYKGRQEDLEEMIAKIIS